MFNPSMIQKFKAADVRSMKLYTSISVFVIPDVHALYHNNGMFNIVDYNINAHNVHYFLSLFFDPQIKLSIHVHKSIKHKFTTTNSTLQISLQKNIFSKDRKV